MIPAEWPLRGEDANYLHLTANVQTAQYSPSVLIDISREPAFLETLPLLHNVSYSGGILPTDAGEVISKRTRLFGGIASTETGILPGEIPPPDMWNYYRYNENPGYELRHYADNMYE